MRNDVSTGDRETLRRRAHSLKGAARLFGAGDLAAAAQALEASAEAIAQPQAIAAIDQLDRHFSVASEEIRSRLAQLSVAA